MNKKQKAPQIEPKSKFCEAFLYCVCDKSSSNCKQAHRPQDLKFKPPSLEEFEEINEEEKIPVQQTPSLSKKSNKQSDSIIVKNFFLATSKATTKDLNNANKFLFEYQSVLVQKGVIKSEQPRKNLNKDLQLQKELYQHFIQDIEEQFLEHLFKIYSKRAIKKELIVHCFDHVGLQFHQKLILQGASCHYQEVRNEQLGNGTYIVKVPQGEDLLILMEDTVLAIIKDFGLIEHLPIDPFTIFHLYYTEASKKDPFLPNIKLYLKDHRISVDVFLDQLVKRDSFRIRFAEKFGLSKAEVDELQILADTLDLTKRLQEGISNILEHLNQRNKLGLIPYLKYENSVLGSQQTMGSLSKDMNEVRDQMKLEAFKKGFKYITITAKTFLFSLEKLVQLDHEAAEKSFKSKPCIKSSDLSSLKVEIPDHLKPKGKKYKLDSAIPLDELEKMIPLSKIIVIDSPSSFSKAKALLSESKIVGVDLEGDLNHGGMIELVQCATAEKVVIFDIYGIRKGGDQSLYSSVIHFLKQIFEDPSICKVFHDSRSDSLALHLFGDCCLQNVFDVSAIHVFILQMEIYSQAKAGEDTQETYKSYLGAEKEAKKLNQPGLNEVLRSYNAPNGTNELKKVMKKRFNGPKDYFLERPIDKEFLVYSAKDVEDLAIVKENMVNKLWSLMIEITGKTPAKNGIEKLCYKISKRFTGYGCSAVKDK